MTGDLRFASPLNLLNDWRDRADEAELHELLLLGFTVDLPFLERVAIPTARALGARITVIGDAAHGLYEAVDVRMAGRSYFHGLASCRGAFHPKLALLLGGTDAWAAVGSGNPTMSGWGSNDELWTLWRSQDRTIPRGLTQLADWLDRLACSERVHLAGFARELLQTCAARLNERPSQDSAAQVLDNLDLGFLEQLPAGPVEELCLYAPFVDRTGTALRQLVEHFDPVRTVLGIQRRWTSYDGDAVLRALDGRDTKLRFLDERHPRHGKLLEWQAQGLRHALTGSPNLTASALLLSTAAGGNCELAVLSRLDATLMPEGAPARPIQLRGHSTIRPIASPPALCLLGALLTSKGLEISLARPYAVEVTISGSPDGSPGSWTPLGTVAPEETVGLLAVPEAAGAVIRATATLADGSLLESPPVFAVHPARCARRQADTGQPRLRQTYTDEEIFNDPDAARRFDRDLVRLADQLTKRSAQHIAAATTSRPATTSVIEDRWAAYLHECERTIGSVFTSLIFRHFTVGLLDPTRGQGWGLGVDAAADDADTDEDDSSDDEAPANVVPHVRPPLRAQYRRWASHWIRAVTTPPGSAAQREWLPPPLILRMLVARLYLQLLAAGIWDLDDDSWRTELSRLACELAVDDHEEAPEESRQHLAVLVAVCMALLRHGASLTGGAPHDIIAARTWNTVKSLVAEASAVLGVDLFLSPTRPRARVATHTEVESLIHLAALSDPLAEARAEIREAGWELDQDGPLWRVTGAFTNPVPVAARVATLLAAHADTVLVQARSGRRWAFIAWRRPDLVLASVPGHAWRIYQISEPWTPDNRFTSGDGITTVGMVGKPVRLGGTPPAVVQRLLVGTGLDHVRLLEILTTSRNADGCGSSVGTL